MANYENGAYTRQAIVDACKKLFYEKGFHETSYADICKAAHVNRTTIYYHFKDKEAMRYEVMWEYTIANKHIAERYCGRPEYHYILAVCMMWFQIKYDENARRFSLSGCEDYPVLTGKMDFSYYYTMIFDQMWGRFYDRKHISELSFASVYCYIMSFMKMFCLYPEKYQPMEMFTQCVESSLTIWGVSRDNLTELWQDIQLYITKIPEEYLKKQPV